MKFGVYLSPWDRNHPSYGRPEYVGIYREQLRELLTNYGELFEVWHDGANGGDGFYGGARETRKIDKAVYYDWPATWELVRKLQPNAVVFSGGSFHLNVPPDRRGLIHENDVKALREFGDKLKQMLAVNLAKGAKATASNVRGNDKRYAAAKVADADRFSYWATDDNLTTAELELDLGGEKTFNVVRVRENIQLGHRVDEFAVDVWTGGQWSEFGKATGIGAQRLLRGQKATTSEDHGGS